MAQGTVAGYSIVKQANKKSHSVEQQLQQAIQHVHAVRQQATIQFNQGVDVGRRKMNEIWRDYSLAFAHAKRAAENTQQLFSYSSELLNFANA